LSKTIQDVRGRRFTYRGRLEARFAPAQRKNAKSDPMYGHFEQLAKNYLEQEGQSCKDLDNQ
jgi:hypothetical protein